MLTQSVKDALEAVDMTYAELIDVVNNIKEEMSGEIDETIHSIGENLNDMSNDYIRNVLVRLSLLSYSFSETKERSAFKSELAVTLRKEAYAKEFKSAEGTVGVKESQALLNTSAEVLAETIHDLLASLFKTKLDEVHRTIDVLKTVLMSRLTEAKLVSSDVQ